MNIKKRLILIILAIILVVLAGSLGYYLLFAGKETFMDCLYMTVIAITSVGFGEVIQITGNIYAEIFTMILITFGMGIILYGLGTLTASLIEGELSGILRKDRMRKKIEKLKNHYIVCGGGETGKPMILEMMKNSENVVLIERDEMKIKECEEGCQSIGELLYVEGDATEDQNLIEAGIHRAAGIVISLPSDKDNLYVTMTSRMLNRNLRIISKMTHPQLEPKLRNAGADGVVSPNNIGALRMASELLRPTVVDFLDSMLRSKQGNLRIHQLTVSDKSPNIGKQISDTGLQDKYGLLVLGSKQGGWRNRIQPSGNPGINNGVDPYRDGRHGRYRKSKKAFLTLQTRYPINDRGQR